MSGYDPITHALELLSLENLDNADPQKVTGLVVELRRRVEYLEARIYLVRSDAVKRRAARDIDVRLPDSGELFSPPMEMSE